MSLLAGLGGGSSAADGPWRISARRPFRALFLIHIVVPPYLHCICCGGLARSYSPPLSATDSSATLNPIVLSSCASQHTSATQYMRVPAITPKNHTHIANTETQGNPRASRLRNTTAKILCIKLLHRYADTKFAPRAIACRRVDSVPQARATLPPHDYYVNKRLFLSGVCIALGGSARFVAAWKKGSGHRSDNLAACVIFQLFIPRWSGLCELDW